MHGLKIAPNLTLPVDAVTQTVAILAKRRAGKSYTMRRFVEQLFTAGQQVVLVDPKGDQWGIRSAADGKGPGLPIVILGGERADVPLETGSGEVVAKLVAEERVSALLDLSLFRKHEVATFMTGFLENLYRLKARESFRTPMMLVIDEADAVAPQKPQKGEERMLGAAEDIVRRGGQRGIGCVLVTQRSAVLNKNVLTQAQILVALRTIAPQDLDAMKAWIDVHGTAEQRHTLMESLPSLPVGDAWFWSPGWPDVDGIFKRVHVLPIETFDSGATPKPGEKRREPKTVADVDLDALKRQMSEVVAKAKANDPKELKAELARLRKQLADKPKAEADPRAVEQAVAAAVADRDRHWQAEVRKLESALSDRADRLTKIERLAHLNGDASVAVVAPPPAVVRHAAVAAPVRRPAPVAARVTAPPSGDAPALGKAERLILRAFYWLRDEEATPAKVAFYSGYAMGSGGFNNALGRLRSTGLLSGWKITPEGEAAMSGMTDPKPTGIELREWLRPKLSKAENAILDTLVDAGGSKLSAADIADLSGYALGSGGFNNAIGRLRSIEAAEGYERDGGTKAADVFFE